MNNLKILGIIPARANSKGVYKKNVKPLNGKPLIQYTIESASNSKELTDFVITTDSQEILNKFGGMERPESLAQDNTPTIDVVRYTLTQYEKINGEINAVCLLQPTSPLRTCDDIDSAINIFKNLIVSNTNKCLYSGYYISIKKPDKIFDKKLNVSHFQRNGAIFLATRDLIMEKCVLWDKSVFNFEMPAWRSIDLDTYEDFTFAEILLKGGALGK